jgi:hypothetical protein
MSSNRFRTGSSARRCCSRSRCCGPEGLVERSDVWAECLVVRRGGFTSPKVPVSLLHTQHHNNTSYYHYPTVRPLYRSSIVSPRTLACALLFDSESASTPLPLSPSGGSLPALLRPASVPLRLPASSLPALSPSVHQFLLQFPFPVP